MVRLLQISGIAGSVLIFFGLVAYFFTRNIEDPYVQSHLLFGTLLVLLYLFTRGAAVFGSLRRQSTRYGIHSATYSLLFIGVLVMINYLNTREAYHYRWDLTEAKVFSLSPQSIKVVKDLKEDLEFFAFFERGANRRVSDLIESYAYHSPRIKFRAIDPDRHPEMARRFKIQEVNTIHMRYGKDSTNLTDTTEEAITNTIIKLTTTDKKNVYFVTGHGEPSSGDAESSQGYAGAREALENENYRVKELLLSTLERVPQDASMVIIAGPQKPFLNHEIEAIEAYLQRGGRLFVLLPPPGNDILDDFLNHWGVRVGDDIVVDQVVRLFSGRSLGIQPIADTYNFSHPVTREFQQRTIFPIVRSVRPAERVREGLEVTPLINTSRTSWAEKDFEGVFKRGKVSFEPKDEKGPIPIGVAVNAELKKRDGEKEVHSKLVVFGSTAFANNRYLRLFFNRDFFLNASNWLVGREGLITIRPRSIRSSRIQLTVKERNTIFYLSFLILPEILLIIGLAVWWRRR